MATYPVPVPPFAPEPGYEGEAGGEASSSSSSSAPLLVGGLVVLAVLLLVGAELIFGVFGILGGEKKGETEGEGEGEGEDETEGETKGEAAAPEPPGRVARYVRIQAGRDQVLNVTEIEVFDEAGALIPAADVVPTLSPQYGDAASFGPQFLVDGQKKSKAEPNAPWKLPHTSSSAQAMMQLDLKRARRVTRVVVHNRDDCCKERITGAKLVLRGEDDAVVCEAAFEGQADVYTLDVSAGACTMSAA